MPMTVQKEPSAAGAGRERPVEVVRIKITEAGRRVPVQPPSKIAATAEVVNATLKAHPEEAVREAGGRDSR
jgi:hypothetical protein